jgi:hypothetical protein
MIFEGLGFWNVLQCNTLSQQMWWFDGRGVLFHLKGQGMKFHKWCVCGQ